jgi:two-component system, chemotaxis family, chemotaxis protein CheY
MAMNVLLVDDSAVMRAMLAKALGMTGLPIGSVHQAANGADALELLARETVDLVLLDISMPVMRGDEMLGRLRALPGLAALPVIVVSSESSAQRVGEMRALGAAFIHKPFSPEQLRTVVLNTIALQNEYCAS